MLEGNRSENNPADNPEREPPYEGTGAENKLPPIVAPPEPPQAPASTEAPDKEPSKWRENTKLGLEIAGVVILICYTVFTYLQWHQIRRTNDLTKTALDGSKDSLGQTLLKMQGQTDATNRLYGEAQKQTAQATTLATNSGIQAGEAKVAAGAATSAANTAKDALHVSERAYVVIGTPNLEVAKKAISLPVQNTGHIPSGKVEVVVHEATVDVPNTYTQSNLAAASEIHWSRQVFYTVTSGVPYNIEIATPKMDADKLNSGLQLIIIAGFISYNDGFMDGQQWPFCIHTIYHTIFKELALTSCDASDYLPKLELVDGYPNNEQKDKYDPPQ